MSKRAEFESILSSVSLVDNQDLTDALNDMLEEAEECGYDNGFEDGEQEAADNREVDDISDDAIQQLRGRHDYLKHGGEWQKPSTATYLEGFEDAMNLLGVKP